MKSGAAQCVLVGSPVDVFTQELFGRGVGRRSHHHVGSGQTADVAGLSGNAEVGQHNSSSLGVGFGQQDVGRLDVAVQQSALMCIVQRVGDGADDLESQRLRHSGGIPAAQQFGGVGSLDVIHRQPQLSLEFAAVVNTDDVGMPQLRGDVCFPAQPLPVLVVRGQRGRQDLEGVAAGQPWMLRQIDLAHAAGSQPPDDGVSGEHVPVVQRHTGLATRP